MAQAQKLNLVEMEKIAEIAIHAAELRGVEPPVRRWSLDQIEMATGLSIQDPEQFCRLQNR